MGHGGKRKGAGRKRKIASDRERVAVGRRCEIMHREETQRQAYGRLEERPRWQMARKTLERLFKSRRRFVNVNAPPTFERNKWNIERDKHERYFIEHVRRPKGHRSAIIDEVAKETGYPKRMVQRCWVEYRAVRKQSNWVRLSDIGRARGVKK